MNLAITRPLASIDIESTGLDPVYDRIIELAIIKIEPETLFDQYNVAGLKWRFNPDKVITPENAAIHGITNEMVAGEPKFSERAHEIFAIINGCDLLGFNLLGMDVPMLWEEFHRCGIEWNTQGVHLVDAGTLFKRREERTLSAAVKFYTGEEHVGAHGAMADAQATLAVLEGQMRRYTDLTDATVAQMSEASGMKEAIDPAGNIIRDKDGDYAYNFGKDTRGVKVKNNPGFGQWMLRRDFPNSTKIELRKILGELEECGDLFE